MNGPGIREIDLALPGARLRPRRALQGPRRSDPSSHPRRAPSLGALRPRDRRASGGRAVRRLPPAPLAPGSAARPAPSRGDATCTTGWRTRTCDPSSSTASPMPTRRADGDRSDARSRSRTGGPRAPAARGPGPRRHVHGRRGCRGHPDRLPGSARRRRTHALRRRGPGPRLRRSANREAAAHRALHLRFPALGDPRRPRQRGRPAGRRGLDRPRGVGAAYESRPRSSADRWSSSPSEAWP